MPALVNSQKTLDPDIWGPHYWFFLHTIAFIYPHSPNSITKKKYYEFIHNLPLFLPNNSIGNNFSNLLDEYPITAYLDSRESLVRWIHFIHNKINEKLEKPKISLNEFYYRYYEEYKPKDVKLKEYYRWKEKIIYFSILLISILIIVLFYKK
jgi:FAD-linked sulfhydryl oxidase